MSLAWFAADAPDRSAVISDAGQRTFGELNTRANQLVRALRARGLVAGDAVALISSNRPEFVEVVAACMRAGWRLTPINWHLTAGEAGYIVEDCEAKAVVAEGRFASIAIDALAGIDSAVAKLAVGGSIAGFESYDDALAANDGSDIDDPVLGGSMLY